LNILIAKRFNL